MLKKVVEIAILYQKNSIKETKEEFTMKKFLAILIIAIALLGCSTESIVYRYVDSTSDVIIENTTDTVVYTYTDYELLSMRNDLNLLYINRTITEKEVKDLTIDQLFLETEIETFRVENLYDIRGFSEFGRELLLPESWSFEDCSIYRYAMDYSSITRWEIIEIHVRYTVEMLVKAHWEEDIELYEPALSLDDIRYYWDNFDINGDYDVFRPKAPVNYPAESTIWITYTGLLARYEKSLDALLTQKDHWINDYDYLEKLIDTNEDLDYNIQKLNIINETITEYEEILLTYDTSL